MRKGKRKGKGKGSRERQNTTAVVAIFQNSLLGTTTRALARFVGAPLAEAPMRPAVCGQHDPTMARQRHVKGKNVKWAV